MKMIIHIYMSLGGAYTWIELQFLTELRFTRFKQPNMIHRHVKQQVVFKTPFLHTEFHQTTSRKMAPQCTVYQA